MITLYQYFTNRPKQGGNGTLYQYFPDRPKQGGGNDILYQYKQLLVQYIVWRLDSLSTTHCAQRVIFTQKSGLRHPTS